MKEGNTQDKKNLKIRDCMTEDVLVVSRETPLKRIIQLLKEHNFHVLPVVEKNSKLVGIVTIDNILNLFQPYSSSLGQLLKANPLLDDAIEPEDILLIDVSPELGKLVVASDIMSENSPTISPEESIEEAYTTMRLRNTDKLLVIDEDKKLLGIVTLFDIILALFKKRGVV